MPSPFPGVDPYLERAAIWPGVHHSLLTYAVEDLQPQLLPRYVAVLGERVFLEPAHRERVPDVFVATQPHLPGSAEPGRGGVAVAYPDVAVAMPEPEWVPTGPGLEIHEGYIDILDRAGDEVVTAIEFLSPWNKAVGPGRDAYLAKQQQVLWSASNLVEIDLLRQGLPTVAAAAWQIPGRGAAHYTISTRRASRPGGFEVLRFTVRDALPLVAVPLRPGDDDVVLHLPVQFGRCYDVGAYAHRVDYTQPPEPPLSAPDAAWAEELLQQKGLRR